MGVIYSIPLCSRGEANKESGVNNRAAIDSHADLNNNQPMPSQHPVTVMHQPEPVSVVNPNAQYDEEAPEATSTPKSEQQRRVVVTPSDMSSDDIIDVDDEDVLTGGDRTSDSGLEQSSSDELELGGAAAAQRPVSRRERLSEAAQGLEPPPLPTDEGINEETLDVTIPLENHLTCDEDDDESEDEEDPVERPPEPTVPDERVDSSEDGRSGSSRQESVSPSGFRKDKDPTANAISNLLSEIVGGDHPYEESPKHVESTTAVAR